MFEIFCDSLQEGMWFRNLHPNFKNAQFIVIPNNKREQRQYGLDKVLLYDRPDIILKDDGLIIFVLERTVEVPSGHNVGQRFGRLVAAAKEQIPVVYFGPYAAYKHGGITSGPRYMNLRLFYSLKNVSDYYNTAITTINWPVDRQYEVLKTPAKDARIKEYVDLFLSYYLNYEFNGLTEFIKDSDFQRRQYDEQEAFAQNEIRNPEQYDTPPDSVEILPVHVFDQRYVKFPNSGKCINRVVVYNVGMTYIRSDPYCGMAALYYYLYCNPNTALVLYFPNIQSSEWYKLRRSTKTYRMFKEFNDAILFQDRIIPQQSL